MRSRLAGHAVFALVLVGVLSCVAPVKRAEPAAKTPVEATLFITGDLRGYLGPCGCSENMRGGIGRAAYVLDEARKSGRPVLLVDSGNSLFPSETLTEAAIPQQKRKAQALAEAFTRMGLGARDQGPLDLTLGGPFVQSLSLPGLDAQGVHTFDVKGAKVAVFAADTAQQLADTSARLKASGADFVVALMHTSLADALKATQGDSLAANLVVATRASGAFSGEENRIGGGATRVVQLQSKGRSLLRVDLSLRGNEVQWLKTSADTERELAALDERIALMKVQIDAPGLGDELKALKQGKLAELMARREALSATPEAAPGDTGSAAARFVPLESSLPTLPEVEAVVTAYDRDVGAINLAWAKEHPSSCPAVEPGKPAYVGTATCEHCHKAATNFWNGTRHSHAFKTLEDKGKQYHLDCVGCHVTGWQKPSGACGIDALEPAHNVGCEACHGPGSIHANAPSKTNIVKLRNASVCVDCHNPENSPNFTFEAYLPLILGPGHGHKIARGP